MTASPIRLNLLRRPTAGRPKSQPFGIIGQKQTGKKTRAQVASRHSRIRLDQQERTDTTAQPAT
jgi:hypothetical protein